MFEIILFLIFFSIFIIIALECTYNLIYNDKISKGSRFYLVIGLFISNYILLIITDFNLDRAGEVFQNRIVGTLEKDDIFFKTTLLLLALFIFYNFRFRKEN
ncbi:hypothetical protein SAMN05421765_0694 [Kaistella antarctica]|uniref:Uncharacterized protein n=1 Tax=Kaistella antarctica TaxID=266748 RepID=A0A448NTX7_9FLAO|nr:hypothetical protein HY04_07430 [Kaistella antarctica]SEV84809.1 hypothetical protein SAMN05421765_0694 [Kaistella antarctica]VEI01029.1 Uncharacterised protein [Kaistella antarctica]